VTNPQSRKVERNAEIVRRYEKHATITSLAAEYGVSRTRIQHILDDARVRRTTRKEQP
jgi:DNA-binding transcriptional regulator LsrR (DeoR family)